ncbi:MAG: hypothetical protein HFH93_01865 [Lachnospiraceae bacterium]|nr:hypothetical protein [Lachnospiraceae bacterium]
MFDVDKGWIAVRYNKTIEWNVICPKLKKVCDGLYIHDNCLHKYPDDEIAEIRDNAYYWMDGFVYNKDELIEKDTTDDWTDTFIKESQRLGFPDRLRGGFSGFISCTGSMVLFNDHVGNHAVYYYVDGELVICSTRVYYVVELIKALNKVIHLDEHAAGMMLRFGYMIDNSTFVKEIRRVLPGQKIVIDNYGRIEFNQYYMPDNRSVRMDMCEEEAIELLDLYFREAVNREFKKDKEYGYKHLVDLSGGLDSRMVTWVGHVMGYEQQMNVTVCKYDYLDYEIAVKLAADKKHSFLFMPLDDFAWFRDADEMARKNNGASLYSGMTGGKRLYQCIDKNMFGIVHTGMVGDSIVGSFFKCPEEGYGCVKLESFKYSDILEPTEEIVNIRKYRNQEIYAVYNRGFMCAQSSYFTIQTFFETSSPFLDVDFLDNALNIPLKLRCGHYIYLKWIETKYPDAAEYGWEKWKGLKPKVKNIDKADSWINKYREANEHRVNTLKQSPLHMNPTDYWYDHNVGTREWAYRYFNDRISLVRDYCSAKLADDIECVFLTGKSLEKTQALTVLAWAGFILR